MAMFLLKVPLKAGMLPLTIGALLCVMATTGMGLLISVFTKTQLVALFGTAILNGHAGFSILRLSDAIVVVDWWRGDHWDALSEHLFHEDQRGRLHQGARLYLLSTSFSALAVFIPVLTILSLAFLHNLHKQEK